MHFGAAYDLIFGSHSKCLACKCKIVGVQPFRQIHEDFVFGAQFLASGRDVVNLTLVILFTMNVVVGTINELSFPAEFERFAIARIGDCGWFVGFRCCKHRCGCKRVCDLCARKGSRFLWGNRFSGRSIYSGCCRDRRFFIIEFLLKKIGFKKKDYKSLSTFVFNKKT